MHAFMNCVAA